ncbi:MAG: ShlB/FhaC/HecB family hemolysin secretion/activation protein [Gammaproteobacteria bacterium]|nr:ShlB/FhaC/HecB family hemolysin secretion/activation protein [Gammaproteobacteria bacterium]
MWAPLAVAENEASTNAGDTSVEVEMNSPQAVDTQASANKAPVFDVREFRVSGNTLLNVKDVERTLYGFLGEEKVFADIEKAQHALEQRYREAGYPAVLVDIPEQSVSDGVVWLKVTESRVSTRRITGSRYYLPGVLAGQITALEPGNKLQISTVQTQIAQASTAFPERAINPILRPGRTPGTVEVELKVEDQLPLHGELEVNDRYGENTSRWRALGSVSYSNLWQRGHSLNIQYQTAPEETDEVQVWSGTYLFRVPQSQSMVVIYAVDSESNTATLGDLNVIGNGNIYGLRWITPWRDDETFSNSLSLGVDYKKFGESIQQQGADLTNTPIDYATFGIDFSRTRQTALQMTRYRMSSGFGVRGLVNDAQAFEDKRSQSQPNYLFLRAGVTHSRALFAGTRLQLEMEGQWANSPLISNEQYAAGGVATVRGYHESQALGDDAVRGRVEWLIPSLLKSSTGDKAVSASGIDGLLFWDGAALHVQQALPGTDAHTELASVGLGLRMNRASTWEVNLDWAKALKAEGSVAKGDTRVHASVRYAF